MNLPTRLAKLEAQHWIAAVRRVEALDEAKVLKELACQYGGEEVSAWMGWLDTYLDSIGEAEQEALARPPLPSPNAAHRRILAAWHAWLESRS